jgi:hypothetical protein
MMEVYLRNLKNAGIFTSLKDITYNILMHVSHQRSIATAGLGVSPEKGSSIARGCNIT